jgi:hypothetical protein
MALPNPKIKLTDMVLMYMGKPKIKNTNKPCILDFAK